MKPMSIAPAVRASVSSPVVALTTSSGGTPSVLASAVPRSRATPCTSPLVSLATKIGVADGAYATPTRSVPVGTSCFMTLSSTAAAAPPTASASDRLKNAIAFMAASQPEHEDHGRARHILHFRRARQLVPGIAEQARCDGDILLAVDRIGDRRGVEAGAQIEAPELLERLIVECHDGAVEQRRYHDAAGGRQRAGKVRIGHLVAQLHLRGRGVDRDDARGDAARIRRGAADEVALHVRFLVG